MAEPVVLVGIFTGGAAFLGVVLTNLFSLWMDGRREKRVRRDRERLLERTRLRAARLVEYEIVANQAFVRACLKNGVWWREPPSLEVWEEQKVVLAEFTDSSQGWGTLALAYLSQKSVATIEHEPLADLDPGVVKQLRELDQLYGEALETLIQITKRQPALPTEGAASNLSK